MWKRILLFFAASLIVIVVGFLAILKWPTLILNRPVLRMAVSYVARRGVDITWNQIDIASQSNDLLDRTLTVSLNDLCVQAPPTIDRLCFKETKFSFRYSLWKIMPKLIEIGPVDASGGTLDYTVAATDKKNERDAFPIPRISLPSWIKDLRVFPVHIGVDEVNVRQKESLYSGKMSLNMEPTLDNRLGDVTATAELSEKTSGMSATANVVLTSPSHYLEDDWKFTGKAKAIPSRGEKASLDFNVSMENKDQLNNYLKLSLTQKDYAVDLSVDGMVQAKKLDEKLSGTVLTPKLPVKKISFTSCDLKLAAEATGFNRGGLDLTCPVSVDFKATPLSPIIHRVFEMPDHLSFALSAHLNTFLFPDLSQKTEGSLHAEIKPMTRKIVTTKGTADFKVSGIPSHPLKEWSMSSKLDLNLVIDQFARLKEALKETDYAIPAPLNVLDGPVTLSIKGDIPSLTQMSTFPVVLETQLSSPKENFNVAVDGEVTVRDLTNIGMDVSLQNIKIELPDLSSTSIPRLFPDPRITTKPAEVSKWSKVKYDVNISTPDNQPVQLVSKYTHGPIPVNLNVQLSNNGMMGDVKVANVSLNLFRRNAVVESIALKLGEPLNQSELNGLLKVSYVDYVISIILLGTVDKPKILFESDPPLSHDDVIATLLYGEPLDKLGAGDSASVGSMSAALASRALALTSLFVLASTPIQSVSYDPATKMFSAKLKLGNKTSLTIGSSGTGSKQVGLQKRIGKGWIVNTNVEAPPGAANTRAAAFIEWNKRY